MNEDFQTEQNPPIAQVSDETKATVIANSQAAMERKRKAKRNLTLLIIGAIVVGAVVWYLQKISSSPLAQLKSFENSLATLAQQNVSNYPAPLRPAMSAAKITQKNTTLTIQGVISETNAARAKNGGLPPLTESKTLDAIAALRLDDMFEYQYFAHVSPTTGQSAETVASSVGYDHLALGENLAEGIFDGDNGVVTAWMNSPGHRANILDVHYTEIGVAVHKDLFGGQQTWIAVQVFGKPTSACPPSPDANLKAAIAAAENSLALMNDQLQQLKTEIDAMQPQSGDAYNQKVAQYNALADQYNALGAQTKTEVAEFNAEVEAYNACL